MCAGVSTGGFISSTASVSGVRLINWGSHTVKTPETPGTGGQPGNIGTRDKEPTEQQDKSTIYWKLSLRVLYNSGVQYVARHTPEWTSALTNADYSLGSLLNLRVCQCVSQ